MEEDKKLDLPEVRKVKTSKGKKFVDLFIAEDVDTAKGYVLTNFIVPGIKNGILELLRTMFYGRGGDGRSYTSFGSNVTRMYWKGPNSVPTSSLKADSYTAIRDYEHIEVNDRLKAIKIIDDLEAILERCDKITIANLYELASTPNHRIPIEPMDYNYGWISMRGFDMIPRGDGWYLIKTPRPAPLK